MRHRQKIHYLKTIHIPFRGILWSFKKHHDSMAACTTNMAHGIELMISQRYKTTKNYIFTDLKESTNYQIAGLPITMW